jgi:hypothetical protein
MWRIGSPERSEDTSDDSALIERLQSLTSSLQPGQVEAGRERLLRAVAERRAASSPRERTTPLALMLGRKRLALVAAGVLAIGTAGAVGASGGVSDAAGNVNDVLAALHVTDRTPDVADEHINDGGQPGEGGDASGASPDENANDNASGGAGNADDGINNGSASDAGLDHAADNATDGSENADGAHDGLPGEASDHADDAVDDADPGVPADAPANDHADLPDEAGDPPVPHR